MRKILFFICRKHYFYFFKELICFLKNNNLVYIILPDIVLTEYIKDIYSDDSINILCGYNSDIIDKISPDLIVCSQIWKHNIPEPLEKAVSKNIPVLMYDHGSLVHRSPYILDNDKYYLSRRADIALASHIACWGNIGRDCWLSFGVNKDKLYLTGALQYDYLLQKTFDKEQIYKHFSNIRNKKVILFFTCFHHPLKTFRDNCFNALKQLQVYIEQNKEQYQLFVKPHPSEDLAYNKRNNIYFEDTIVCDKDNAEFTDELVFIAECVFLLPGSVVLTPLLLNKPIVHVQTASGISSDFQKFAENKFIVFNENKNIQEVLSEVSMFVDYDNIKSKFNYMNDGKSLNRFLQLINDIFLAKEKNKSFYEPKDIEYKKIIEQMPEAILIYEKLCLYYANENDVENVLKWLNLYFQKAINDNDEFLKEIFTFLIERLSIGQLKDFMLKVEDKSILKERKANIFYNKAMFYLKQDDFDEAINSFHLALDSIDNDNTLLYRTYYRLGDTLFKKAEFDQAEEFLVKCLQLCPEHNAAKDLLLLITKKENLLNRNRDYLNYIDLQVKRSRYKAMHNNDKEILRRSYSIERLAEFVDLSKIKNLLIIGCRTVDEINLLATKGVSTITAIDLFSTDERIMVMDMHNLLFEDGRFDLLYCSHALEHSYDYKKAISEMLRVATNNAYIFIEVPIDYDVRGADLHDFVSAVKLKQLFYGENYEVQTLLAEDISCKDIKNLTGTAMARVILKIKK